MLKQLKALADPTRLRLVGILARGEFTVQELTAILAMGQSRISRHLKILTDAGILSVKRQGTWSYYRLAGEEVFFARIRPALESNLDTLPWRQADLHALAEVLEGRRRKSQEFFDQHARQWDQLCGKILPAADYRGRLLEQVPTCETILEVGIGTGTLLGELSRRARRLIGVDHSPAMIREARQRVEDELLRGVELRLGEMSHLPLSDGDVQSAVLNMVFHHAAQPPVVLKELHRVLNPGGLLIVADLLRHEKEWAREQMADQWLGFEKEELRTWLQGAGFLLESYLTIPGGGETLGVFILTAKKGTVPPGPTRPFATSFKQEGA